jgi:MerR family copper efflux transcriptional regulator
VAKVKRAAEKKLADVDARLVALTRVRDGLATLVATCPGHGRAADCPILKALGEERLQ